MLRLATRFYKKISNLVRLGIILCIICIGIYFFNKKKTCVKFVLDASAGFFSQFFFLCHVYIYSKKNNYDFFIEDSTWKYSYKNGWHDYFTTLNRWNENMKSKYDKIYSFKHCTINTSHDYTMNEYISSIKEIFKVTNVIQERANKFINNIGTHYNSIYIRRGDKIADGTKEMDALTASDIISKTDIKNEGTPLFVMTDDYSIINKLGTLLDKCKIFTTTLETTNGMYANNIDKMSSEETKEHIYDLLSSCIILVNGSCWSDTRSNVGRFHKLYSFDKVKLYPTTTILKRTDKIQPWANLVEYDKLSVMSCGVSR